MVYLFYNLLLYGLVIIVKTWNIMEFIVSDKIYKATASLKNTKIITVTVHLIIFNPFQ